jgi:predicted ribosomally synthesized peptide with SipW-like signal peptide
MSKNFAGRSKGFKVMSLVLAFVLVVGASVAGTLAWLTAQTETVTNTFTSAELFSDNGSFTLWEHKAVDTDGDGVYTPDNSIEVKSNSYSILPGVNIPKDPTVDVVGLEEHAYLYIKVTSTLPEGLTYSIYSENWTALSGYDGVYVYSGSNAENNIIKATNAELKTFTATILTGNQIVVADNYSGTNDDIKLSFDAYMVQATGNGDSAAAAWANTYGKTTD